MKKNITKMGNVKVICVGYDVVFYGRCSRAFNKIYEITLIGTNIPLFTKLKSKLIGVTCDITRRVLCVYFVTFCF